MEALARLEPLLGEWTAEVEVGDEPVPIARTRFEWIEDGAFLLQRTEAAAALPEAWRQSSPFPQTALIGADDAGDELTMLYADGRGVRRVYRMTLADGLWRVWRDAPGFCQRFAASFEDGGSRVRGAWEKSADGTAWEHDFDVVYTRVA